MWFMIRLGQCLRAHPLQRALQGGQCLRLRAGRVGRRRPLQRQQAGRQQRAREAGQQCRLGARGA